MQKILILNGAVPHNNSIETLNSSFAERARDNLVGQGHEVRLTNIAQGYDIDAEVAAHVWADAVILQFPVHWMGLPWTFKKYFDEVYTANTDNLLFTSDGRTNADPKRNYGMGGVLTDTRYMLSVTFNAPSEAFDNPDEPFFAGKSVDDMLLPVHKTLQFLGMKPTATFSAHDVVKNAEIESDFARFDTRIAEFAAEGSDAAAA
ncbi:NAD(P)H-dependent oxidoreductase [Halocynthiibacter sp. C4]|uniref:NAD(P)H-dependent oxidoreductase n=1 Tax=Halocynthiibacter sp. C4 TaxID=2992758 RepID=UPI00237C0E4B|nr:NAD(P)H-dependent oxidoreductase [Halocynthiibacter sp. C4]MDE0591495.1 NAD(P)H-dependent oxidoreductase [Halocynthiibacter sp. C4]